jgi:tyrosyl-tRNA synthetase
MSSFIQDTIDRGFFYQCTAVDELKKISESGKICAYIGFDATAGSLHVGNLMQIMILRLLQKHGHKPIVLIGGVTSLIGDPTGKDQLRKVLSEEDLEKNIQGIKKSLSKFIKFGEGDSDAIILNNSEWLSGVGYIEFLRDYGRLISVNKMLTMDSVKSRLDREQQLTFLEFNYMLLQGYDFAHLFNKHNCILQIGGSDQWGNILSGVELIHKKCHGQAFGLTTQLITNANGVKMGKSVNGAVWINEDMLSPYEYYQFWRNCDDRDIVRFAKLYAEFNDLEMQDFIKISEIDINKAKKDLAFRLTLMCHGEEEAVNARDLSVKVFEQKSFSYDEISENVESINIDKSLLEAGIAVSELLCIGGLCSSKSEAKNLIKGGGARLNDRKVENEHEIITYSESVNGIIKLSAGKKKFSLIKFS